MGSRASTSDSELLKRAAWFGSLPAPLQDEILERSVVRSYRRGEYLLREGDPPKGMYAILQGRTRHLRSVGEGDEALMHVGEPGLWVGEYPLLCGEPSVGSVIADTAVRTLFLSAAQFESIVEREPQYLRHFARLLCERFALAFRFLAEARGLAPDEWLFNRLVGVARLQQLQASPRTGVEITLSQSQLANMVGLSRQTLNVLLKRLEARGLVAVGYRSVRLLQALGASSG